MTCTILVTFGILGSLGGATPDAPAVSPQVRQRCLDVLDEVLRSGEFWPSMHAAEALTQAGRAAQVRERLGQRLSTERDDLKRCGLARELVRAGDRTRVAVLLEILALPDLDKQVHAAESLYKVVEVGDSRLLRKAMAREDQVALQLMAAGALARCGNPQALALLRKRLTGADAQGRMYAAWILSHLRDRADLPALVEAAKNEQDTKARLFVSLAPGCFGEPGSRDTLAKDLESSDPEARAYAAEVVGVGRIHDLAPRLEKLLGDKVPDVRVRAAQALIALATPREDPNEDFARDVYPATAEHPRYSEGSIEAMPDGTLLYATSEFSKGADDFDAAHIIARTSADGARTWGPARVLQENIGKKNVMSATLRWLEPPVREDAALGLFYLVTNDVDDLKLYLRTSRDGGRSFGPPVLITNRPGYHVMNNDRVTRVASGRLLCPVAWTDHAARHDHYVSLCWLSDDAGKTWRAGKGRVDLPKRGAMEPEVVELDGGRLLMILRTQLGHVAVSSSTDGGDTWSKPEPWHIKSPESPATIRRVPATGDLLLIWNNTFRPGGDHGGKRTPLTAAVSADEGRTWQHVRDLENRTDQTYAYTSVLFVRDRALLTYYVADDKTGRLSSRIRSLPVRWFYEDKHEQTSAPQKSPPEEFPR